MDVSLIRPDLVETRMLGLQLDYPGGSKLTLSGQVIVLKSVDITRGRSGIVR